MRQASMLSTILFAVGALLVSSAPATADTTSLLGKPAPDFSLTTLDGKMAKLSAQKGKVVVICFWQSWDVPDQELLPYIQEFSANKGWARKGLVVWAIATDNPRQMAGTGRKVLKDGKYTFDVPYDSTQAVLRSYLAPGTPTTVVIGSDGIIKNVAVSFADGTTRHEIGAAIERALAESGKLDATDWIGKPAPAFLLIASNGTALHFDGRGGPDPTEYDYKYVNKVLLITFWADRTSSAIILPHVQELVSNKDFVRKGLIVMAVATGGQTQADVRKFLQDNHYTFEVPFDTAFASWEDSLGKEMTTFVIGRRGLVTSVIAGTGASATKQIDDAVASALDERVDYQDMSLSIGKPAPDFSLTTLDGKTVRLSDQRGKVVLLDFWATWCHPCQITLPHTQELADNRDLANKGLVVWAITQPDELQSLADARSFVAGHKYTFAVPCDQEGTVSQAYGINGIPRFAVVGRDGLIKTWGGVFEKSPGGGLQFLPKRIDDSIASALAESRPAVSSNVQPTPPPTPRRPASPAPSSPPPAPTPSSPAPSSPPAPQPADPLASVWQSAAYAGQTFRFKHDGDAIYVYGEQQGLLGTLQAKEKKGAIDMYQGLVQIAPVTQCPGGSGLMQIKSWNENRLDAKIETPVNGAAGITCGGVLGSSWLIPWEKVTFVKR
jgi:peroxiredoxin